MRAMRWRNGMVGGFGALMVLAPLDAVSQTLPASGLGRPASVIVAPADAPPEVRAGADLVAAGRNDERILLESVRRAPRHAVAVDASPADQETVSAHARHSVLWLPGTYRLDAPLVLPDTADVVIQGEGAVLDYRPADGDAVTVTGAYRSRYHFGTILVAGTGAALRIAPTAAMPTLMSEITFTGLVGGAGRGVGLLIDPSRQNVTTSRISGTDVGGFETCVAVLPPAAPDPQRPGLGKMDTNHVWLSYVRRCRTGIAVDGARGVDSNSWDVNVDASLPDSVAIRSSASFDRWRVIMGTWGRGGTALILDAGAKYNVFDVTPPLEGFAFRDDSGNDTNLFLGVRTLSGLPRPPKANRPPSAIALVQEGIGPGGAYNLLRIDDRFVAVRQDLGPVSFSLEVLGERDLPPQLYRAAGPEEVRRRIVADGRDPADYATVPYRGGAVAYRRALDPLRVGIDLIGSRSLPPHVMAGASAEEVRRLLLEGSR